MKVAKFLTGGVLLMVLLVAGFLFGMRSCLSQYDERSALPPILSFQKDSTAIVFSLVKLSTATSYSSTRGMVHKTSENTFYLQTNNALTGEKLLSKKIEGHEHIKQYPVEVLGAANNAAWIFADEPIAYDAFTLQKIADLKMIEEKNPLLKGKLPADKKYYRFNENKTIGIKANDGSDWVLNTATLLATPEGIEIKDDTKSIAREVKELQDRLKAIQFGNISFTQMTLNQDTANGHWLGIYSPKQLVNLYERVYISASSNSDERRQVFESTYEKGVGSQFMMDKKNMKAVAGSEYFLGGGFLLNRQNGQLIHPEGDGSYIIVYKNEIGNDAAISICSMANNAIKWKLNTALTQWMDWICNDQQLYIFGSDEAKGNSRMCKIMLTVNLNTGLVKKYSYFTDKVGL